MHWVDASYFAVSALLGGTARALDRGLPEAWSLRLNARPPELPAGWTWIHAVSVGELLLADGLLGRLRQAGLRVHVTTGTPAGLGLLQKRLPGWNRDTNLVTGGPFPLDDPAGLEPFFRVPPRAFVALETELWPGLLRELERRGIPRGVVNGRLTARTLGPGGPWLRRAASRLTLVAARDEASLEAFQALGAAQVHLGGNLKADLPDPTPLHAGWGPLEQAWDGAPVLLAGNTVEGEEVLVLDAWKAARAAHPDLKLVLAPRRPGRFGEVAGMLHDLGLGFHRASQPWPNSAREWHGTHILLLDTLGELAAAYALGTVAMVGGGWTWHGGHNPLEPLRYGLATLLGPGYENFQDLVEPLRAAGQVTVVPPAGLGDALGRALEGATLRPARDASAVPPLPDALRGALPRTCRLLRTYLGLPID